MRPALPLLLACCLLPRLALAHDVPLPAPITATQPDPYAMSVQGQRPRPLAASQHMLTGEDILAAPRGVPYDVLRLVPNLVVGLHEGGGKAPQYLLRGFDADHGSDLAVYVDGIPINEVSHVHGLGYLDLHFLIPELIDKVDARKGPYAAEDGSSATAGAMRLTLRSSQDSSEVGGSIGSFGTRRALAIGSGAVAGGSGIAAFESQGSDGFTVAGQSRRVNAQTKLALPVGRALVEILGLFYAGTWDAPGLLPQRAVISGQIPRFGAFNPTDGGTSQRALLSATVTLPLDGGGSWRTQLYVQHKNLTLFHDFTGFAEDPIHGDQIAQIEARTTWGGESVLRTVRRLWGLELRSQLGVQMRADSIAPELWHTVAREKREQVYGLDIAQTTGSVFLEEDLSVTPRLGLRAGVRVDDTAFQVQDLHEDLAHLGNRTSGERQAFVPSPKFGAIYKFTPDIQLYLDYGNGFRLPHARAAVAPGFAGIAKALGAEAGLRTLWLDRKLQVTGVGWWMDTDRDVAFNADSGDNEEIGPARRYGGELDLRIAPWPWLHADLDAGYTWAHARATGLVLARAPRLLLSGNVTANHASGVFGSVRMRHVGAYALDDGGAHQAQPYTITDVLFGWQGRWLQIAVQAQNLFDAQWRDSEYVYASRLQGEAAPVSDVHFRPGEPRSVMATGKVLF